MKFSAQQISDLLQGEVEGNKDVWVDKLAKIEEGVEGAVSFLSNPKYNHFLYTTEASIVIINRDFVLEGPVKATLIRVEDAYSAFTRILEAYNQARLDKTGMEEPHHVSQTATIGENAYVGAFAYIGDYAKIGTNVKIYPHVYIGDGVKIGDNTTLYSGVRIYHDCVIGQNCTIHSNAVIGADGFGFAPTPDGTFKKVPQIGNVVIEDDVEIGACTTIDRATMGSTRIHRGVKLDNSIQIAHNVEIGENTVMASQVGIAGSAKVGRSCMFGGQVGVAGHLTIGDNVHLGAKAGIISDLKDGVTVVGAPSMNHSDFMKSFAVFRRLPQMDKRLCDVEKKQKKKE